MATATITKKTCTCCGKTLDLSSFSIVKRTGKPNSQCKNCISEKSKAWRENNPEKVRQYSKKWRENNPEKVRQYNKEWRYNNPDKVKDQQLRYNYGIDLSTWNKMLVDQNYECACCHRKIDEKTCVVDHDHNTGEVRELLCHHCNVGLGHAEDQIRILMGWISYLIKHNAKQSMPRR